MKSNPSAIFQIHKFLTMYPILSLILGVNYSGFEMPDLNEILSTLRKHKSVLSEKYSIRRIAIFGSFARGDATESSDLDVMVELSQPIGLDFVSLGDELEEMLQIKVDLLSAAALKDSLRNSVYEDIVYV